MTLPFRVPHNYVLNCGVGVRSLCRLKAEFLLCFLPLPVSGLESRDYGSFPGRIENCALTARRQQMEIMAISLQFEGVGEVPDW